MKEKDNEEWLTQLCDSAGSQSLIYVPIKPNRATTALRISTDDIIFFPNHQVEEIPIN